jgi:membrane protease YdiL (CAAX protease family)
MKPFSHSVARSLRDASAPPGRSPLTFFLLVPALATPFLVFGAVTGYMLMPGVPVAALMFVCPGLAGLILSYRENGAAGAKALLKRAFDFKRIKARIWYVPILLIPPGVAVLMFVVLRVTGTQVPAPQFSALIVLFLSLSLLFFVAATGEELGWSGYVIEPLQNRWGALRASLVLGAIWAAFHYIALVQAHRSVVWIAWWSLGTVAMRVIMVWNFNNTGKSVFGATLFHMMANLSWQLFPIRGSYADERSHGLIMAVVAATVVLLWGASAPSRSTSTLSAVSSTLRGKS